MIFLCSRPDPFRYRLWIRERKAELDPTMADFNYQEVTDPNFPVRELVQSVTAMPMMSDRRIVEVHGLLARLARQLEVARTAEQARTEAQLLLQTMANLPAESWLILTEPLDGSRIDWSRRFQKASRGLTPTLETLRADRRMEVVNLARPGPKDLEPWIQERCRKKKLACGARVIRLLAERVGHDLQMLDLELDKLSAYANGTDLAVRDVQALVTDYREEPVFRLGNAVFQQNRREALSTLAQLLEQGLNPIQILATLGTQVRLLAAIRLSSRHSDQEIAHQMGVKPYAVVMARRNANRYTPAQVITLSDMLLEADYAMKSQPDAELVLEVLIGRMVFPESWPAMATVG